MKKIFQTAAILAAVLATSTRASATTCWCGSWWSGGVVGFTQTSSQTIPDQIILYGPAYEKYASAECYGPNNDQFKPTPDKKCHATIKCKFEGKVEIGGELGPKFWKVNFNLEVTAGVELESTCDVGPIHEYCSACGCACWIPKTTTIISGICEGDIVHYTFDPITHDVISQYTDHCRESKTGQVTVYKGYSCGGSFDFNKNGHDDALEQIAANCCKSCPKDCGGGGGGGY